MSQNGWNGNWSESVEESAKRRDQFERNWRKIPFSSRWGGKHDVPTQTINNTFK